MERTSFSNTDFACPFSVLCTQLKQKAEVAGAPQFYKRYYPPVVNTLDWKIKV